MGKIVEYNQPCPDPECGSHDALQIYESGTSFCFSCRKFFSKAETANRPASFEKEEKETKKGLTLVEINELPNRGFKEREIEKAIGYEPKTSIQEGLPQFISWYKEYYKTS